MVAERDEVEDEQGGGEDAAVGEAEFLMFESTVNQFLLAAPMKPEVLGKDAWPVDVAPPSKMSVAHRDCVLSANMNLTKAVSASNLSVWASRLISFFLRCTSTAASLLVGPGESRGTLLDDLEEADVVVAGLLVDLLPHLNGLC